MTQAKLAEAVGLTEQAISKIERGQSGGSLQTLEALAGALGISVRELFPAGPGVDVREEAVSRIATQLSTLSPAELDRIEAVIAAVLR